MNHCRDCKWLDEPDGELREAIRQRIEQNDKMRADWLSDWHANSDRTYREYAERIREGYGRENDGLNYALAHLGDSQAMSAQTEGKSMRRRRYVVPLGDKWLNIEFNIIEAFCFDVAMHGLRRAIGNLWDDMRTYGTKHVEFAGRE